MPASAWLIDRATTTDSSRLATVVMPAPTRLAPPPRATACTLDRGSRGGPPCSGSGTVAGSAGSGSGASGTGGAIDGRASRTVASGSSCTVASGSNPGGCLLVTPQTVTRSGTRRGPFAASLGQPHGNAARQSKYHRTVRCESCQAAPLRPRRSSMLSGRSGGAGPFLGDSSVLTKRVIAALAAAATAGQHGHRGHARRRAPTPPVPSAPGRPAWSAPCRWPARRTSATARSRPSPRSATRSSSAATSPRRPRPGRPPR